MQPIATRLPGLVILEPAVFGDERGFFSETYRRQWHAEVGFRLSCSSSRTTTRAPRAGRARHALPHRGGRGQARAVRARRIVDVVVDLRRGSPTYGQWEAVELDDQGMRMLYVPVGFAHGFCVLSEIADVLYKQTAYYDPAVERGIAWDDPEIGIEWPLPLEELIVSERDKQAPRLSEVAAELPFVY